MKKFKLIAASLFATSMALAGCDGGGCKEHIDEDKNHICDVCGQTISECVDENKDHECDYCEKSLGDHIDEDGDYLCDVCGEQLPQVTGVSIVNAPESIMRTKTVTLKANVSVKGGASKGVTWSVSNDNAKVSSKGVVTGLKVGTVSVTATSKADPSKSDTVEIEIVELYWTEDELAVMGALLDKPLPFIDGSWEFDDSYIEDYGAIELQSDDKDALKTARAAFEADSNFNYLGTSYDEEYECDDYYYSRPSVDYLGYETYVDIYELDGTTTIDVYFMYIEYEEWPTDEIKSYMEYLGFDGIEVKEYEFEEGVVIAAPEMLEGGEECLYIGVSDGVSYANDYAKLYDPSDYIVVDYESEFLISPLDKSCTMYVYDTNYGFDIIVCDYIPDERFYIEEEYPLVAVNDTLALTLFKGVDIDVSETVAWSVDDGEIASVDQSGVVTAIGRGTVTVTASIGEDYVAETTVYVLGSIPTEFSGAITDELDKIHTGLRIPFSPYFDQAQFDEETGVTKVYSSLTAAELDNYYDALVADGWVDIIDAEYGEGYSELFYYFGIPYEFEKEVVIDEVHYWISLELSCETKSYDEDAEEWITEVDTEGYLTVRVSDNYIYSYSDAVTEFGNLLEELEVETTAELPEALSASHFAVVFNEEDVLYGTPAYVEFVAFDCTATATQVSDALNETGWITETEHVDEEVDEETGYTTPAYDAIYGYSEDEVLEIEGYILDGDLVLDVYTPEEAGGAEAFMVELLEIILDDTPVAGEDYYVEDGDVYCWFDCDDLTEDIDDLYALLSQYYICSEPAIDSYDTYDFQVYSDDFSFVADIYSDTDQYGNYIEIDIYDLSELE